MLLRVELLLLLLCTSCWGSSEAFFFFLFAGKCISSNARCFFGFGYTMRRGAPLTAGCEDICTFFPIFAGSEYDCGECDPPPGPPPTVSPAPTPLFLESFQIDLDLNDVPLSDRFLFRQARDTWTDIVTHGLPDFDSSGIPENLFPESPCKLPTGVIDDLYICVQIKKFDRKDENIIASAAPKFARTKDEAAGNPGLPVTGFLSINEDKVKDLIDDGIYQKTIEHEIAHVLGYGTLWGREGFTDSGGGVCFYRGPNAVSEYRALSGCNDLPLEGCGHWSECMGRELLTATIEPNTGTALSRVTIGALDDLGYVVDYSMADPSYTRIDISLGCRCFRRMNEDGDDELAFEEIRPKKQRKLLSKKGYDTVYKYGKAFLDEQEELAIALEERSAIPEGLVFVGNTSVNVLYIEEGTIYSVTVRADQ